ncbi:leucyl aminopeptidase [Xenorhabdus sp. TS4]|uniref:leucyl aminopeptidase n=1 Tax=Xenorhabdus sp. TS4 TaxID=1873483 RepID=UPI0016569AB4|nr:leucyl aminopeptidase [Xenorhabdus sp. TS4]MBC8950201.1 hypothetical protein [Xenorhabdus sp. TS4]
MLIIDEKNKSIRNMFSNLFHHPSVNKKKENGEIINLLIGWDERHKNIIENISSATTEFPLLKIYLLPLDSTPSSILIEQIEKCDVFMFFYLSSTLKPFTSSGPQFLSPIRQVMQENWRKSIIFKDYGEHFYEAFSEQIEIISNRNQSWTSIDGKDSYDITPGEIATKLHNLEGCITFSGTFLSTIPFAIKYGVVKDFFRIKVKNSQIIDFTCRDPIFSQDFDKYLSANPSNSVIEEFGIGTNYGVKRLYGLNAGFEERHPGLHLGLGGGAMGSHHLDLIFQGGNLFFDKKKFFHKKLFNI